MRLRTFTLLLLLFYCAAFSQSNDALKDSIASKLMLANEKKNLSNFDEAIEIYNDIIALSQEENYEISIANAYTEIANIYYLTNKSDDAIEMLIRASQIQRRIGDTQGLSASYNTYGLIYSKKGEFDKAMDYFDIAENNFKNLNLEESLSEVQLNKGLLHYKRDELTDAILYIEESLKTAEGTSNKYNNAKILINYARVLNGLGNSTEAIKKIRLAFTIAQEEGFRLLSSDAKMVLSEIHESNGDYLSAFKELKEHLELKDVLFSISKEKLTQEAQARFNMEENVRLLQKERQEKEAQVRLLKRNRLVSYLTLALGTILLLFTISLYRNNKNRSKINALLQKKNDDLRQANNSKAQFLSTVTHELRTPLYAVTGLTDILLDKSPTEEQKTHLKSLKFSGDYLLNFINDILHINKIEANKLEVEKVAFNVEKLVNSVIIAFNSSEKNNGNDIIFDFDDTIPTVILGDSVKLSQILFNLVGNAIKFTEKGKIWIRIKNGGLTDNAIKLRFEIEDTGIGISEEKLEEIFESFSQGSIQINRKYGGTGLGLTIVKNLLELLGSKIYLKSKEGLGTMFYFDINYEKTELQEEIEAPKRDYSKLAGKKILIVEDIKVNQLITQKILHKQHIITQIIDNGTDAVNLVRSKTYDLILMDIHMPGISGLEATKLIRDFNKDIPIIALTAITIDDKIDDFYNAGFDDILSKPFKPNDLFDKIMTLIVKKPLK